MARIGMNPARQKVSEYRPARVTVALLVYLPYLSGYFEHRFEVVRLCLGTLLKNTRAPFDLLVFDNGSCAQVKAYLHDLLEQGAIRYLLTSHENIGKLGALRLIAGAAPGELIAYSDDDTFFYPGWLEAHLALVDGFPNVGMVSGCPERTLFDHGIDSNFKLAERDPDVRLIRGQSIPLEWEREWAQALGKDMDRFLQQVQTLPDYVLERNGLKAYATASHNQFLIPRPVLLEALGERWSGRLMGGMNEFDNRLDAAGFLRLATHDRTTRLIGNVVTQPLAQEAARFGVEAQSLGTVRRRTAKRGLLQRFVRWGPIWRLVVGIYNRLFWLITGQSGEWYLEQDE